MVIGTGITRAIFYYQSGVDPYYFGMPDLDPYHFGIFSVLSRIRIRIKLIRSHITGLNTVKKVFFFFKASSFSFK